MTYKIPKPDVCTARESAPAVGVGAIPADGCGSMADHELVACIAGVAPQVAQRVLDSVGGLAGLRRAGLGLLCDVDGIGPSRAGRLLASAELAVRLVKQQHDRHLANAEAVADYMRPRIGHLDHEEMWVLAMDGRNRLRGARRVAQGGRHGLSVTAREILSAALLDAASGFVLVHNHPSGSAEPSGEDVTMTDAVAAAAAVVGVPLLDHVIVTATSYRSLL
jgi:DNA repair protein RadC